MNEKKQSVSLPVPSSTYQTGSTTPPKNHAGVVSFLLSATIVICSISTIFSLARINLLQKWDAATENQVCTLAFAESPQVISYGQQQEYLQMWGESVNVFWQNYHDLPQGIYVTNCTGQPLCIGDVITQLNGKPVYTWESFNQQLSHRKAGDIVEVTVIRNQEQLQLKLTIYE